MNIFIPSPSPPHSLLFPSSVEMGWQPGGWISFTLLGKDFTLQGACGSGAREVVGRQPFVLQSCSNLEEIIYPQLFPFKLISKATGLVSSCCACQGWL